MKIIYYREGDTFLPGILTTKGIVAVSDYPAYFGNIQRWDKPLTIDAFRKLKTDFTRIDDSAISYLREEELEIGPCVPFPQKIICIGLNYKKHAEESNMPVPETPVVFSKFANTLVSYGNAIHLNTPGEQFDYEVELGVVIGKECRNVEKQDALKYVLGYCTANDLSCRDQQFMTSQWLLGKTPDDFLPLGKYMLTADELDDPQDLQLTCTMNGELRQSSTTADMIFSVTDIISFLSKYMTLSAGDLILTGTPSGVIMGLAEKRWLKDGDIVRVEIEKLGYTENRMIGESR